LLASANYQYLFWADAASSLGYAFVIAVAVPETLHRRTAVPSTIGQTGTGNAPSDVTAERPNGFRAVLRDNLFLRVCLATLFVSLTYVQAMSTLPIYLGQLGIGPKTYGRLIAINGAMIVVLQLFVTRFVSRFDRGIALSLAALVTAFGFGATAFASSVWHFAATIVIWTLGEMMQSPVLLAVAADLAPSHLRARYFGTLTMCFSGANLVAASVSGLVLARFGGPSLWGMSFIVASIGAVLYASSIPALRSRHDLHA
jgi:MFS family permease